MKPLTSFTFCLFAGDAEVCEAVVGGRLLVRAITQTAATTVKIDVAQERVSLKSGLPGLKEQWPFKNDRDGSFNMHGQYRRS